MLRALVLNDSGSCNREAIDFSSGAVVVAKPVGKLDGRAGNLPEDVKTVQKALNAIPVSKGGRSGGVPLKVDGICGPKTTAAILQYQTKFAGGGDSRVDPGGRTARQLGLDQHPFHAPDEELVKMVLALVPQARFCIRAAQTKLEQARPAFEGRSGGLLAGVHEGARTLVNRHFALHRFPDWRREFIRIGHVFATMELVIARGYDNPLAQWQGVFVPNTSVSQENRRAEAYTYAGGWRHHGGLDPLILPFAQRSDRIYICRRLAKKPDDYRAMAIVHELAHFVGENDGSPDMIDDHAGGWVDAPKMKALPPWRQTRNAQSFANFAFEAAHGHKPVCL